MIIHLCLKWIIFTCIMLQKWKKFTKVYSLHI